MISDMMMIYDDTVMEEDDAGIYTQAADQRGSFCLTKHQSDARSVFQIKDAKMKLLIQFVANHMA